MDAAIANIAKAIEGEDVKASFELLKAVGIYGDAEINCITDWRLDAMITRRAEAQAEKEGHVKDTMRGLLDVSDNPAYRHRVKEIEDALWEEYGDTSNGMGSE